MHLLLAEDEAAMAEAVIAFLSFHHYTLDWVDQGTDVLPQLHSHAYDGLILDIMLPGLDGLSILKALRQEGNVMPTLLLTARSSLEDRIRGFESGTDDYLPKPFAMEELRLRIDALMRRSEYRMIPERTALSFHGLSLDSGTARLHYAQNSEPLTRREAQLMELLMNNQGICLSTEDMLTKVWGYDTDADLGVVWVYISYLRKRLTALGSAVEIKARRGVGYTLEAGL